ncbi:putative photosystem I PsaH, reaction centre subunit VI [Helianthus anomalus]
MAILIFLIYLSLSYHNNHHPSPSPPPPPPCISTSATSKISSTATAQLHQPSNSVGAMASLAIFTPTTTIKGLAGSSISGTKLNLWPARQSLKPTSYRAGAVVAKYGEKSVYFDLEDLGNTTGERMCMEDFCKWSDRFQSFRFRV